MTFSVTGGKAPNMSRSSLIIVMALVLLIAVPAGTVVAQVPVQISADVLEGEGTAVIWDDAALSDAITFTMTGVTAPAAGTAYEGWLVSDDGTVKLSTGIITVEADGSGDSTFDSSSEGNTGQNLIHNYDKALITVEPVPDADPGPSGAVAFSAQIPAGAMAHIRHLLTNWPPGTTAGILTNLQTNLEGAILHTNLAKNADTLDLKRLHTHHVINAIEGEGGDNYDISFGDPAGDGIGVLAHAALRLHAGLAEAAAVDDATIALHAALVEAYGANAELWAGLARDQGPEGTRVQSQLGGHLPWTRSGHGPHTAGGRLERDRGGRRWDQAGLRRGPAHGNIRAGGGCRDHRRCIGAWDRW